MAKIAKSSLSPFYDSDGPGKTLNGSVRPRWASLRPDGVRTVPTVARTAFPGVVKGLIKAVASDEET